MGYGEVNSTAPKTRFSTKIEDLREQLVDIPNSEKALVMKAGKSDRHDRLSDSEDGHDNYGRIDPFWDWLFVHYAGLLQIDDEGYYNQDDQVLEVE